MEEITFSGLRPRKPVMRHIRRLVESWRRKKNQQDTWAFVKVERDPEVGKYGCRVRLRAGEREWRGFALGKSAEEAVCVALRETR